MTTDPASDVDPTLPTDTRPPRWRRPVVGLAVLALAGAGLTGVALATSTPTPGPTESAAPEAPLDDDEVRRPDGPFGALHGEFVVPDGDGGYRTVVMQRGTATEVGDDSITVESEDGFSRTYDVPADAGVGALREGLTSIEEGTEVSVAAERDGDDLTALHVRSLEDRGFGPFGGFGGLGHHGPGGWRA